MTGKNRSRYSSNWDTIALEVKSKSDWKCTRCGMQCLRPTDKRDGLNRRERSIKTLVVHHRNYTPEDNRAENLAAAVVVICCSIRADGEIYHQDNYLCGRKASGLRQINSR